MEQQHEGRHGGCGFKLSVLVVPNVDCVVLNELVCINIISFGFV